MISFGWTVLGENIQSHSLRRALCWKNEESLTAYTDLVSCRAGCYVFKC